MANPSYVADPYVTTLSQLLEDIRQGFLLVPRFQRPFIWPVDRQLELLRSIRDGLPIGSVMIWRTRTQEIPCYERMGRHRVENRGLGPGSTRQYVLDGFQRLSTLYGALHQEDAADDEEDEEGGPRFYLDLETVDFCTEPVEGAPEDRFLPMEILLQRMELLRWERKLREERWIGNAEAVFNAFDRCKIPVIPLVTEDLETATQAFERINTPGVPVGRIHVARALSWSPGFDLLERAKQLKEEILTPIGWGEIDDDLILDTCALTLGIDLHEKNMARAVAGKLRARPDVLEEAVQSLQVAAQFLGTQGLRSPALVPDPLQIILLAAALPPARDWNPTLEQSLAAWLWLTTYVGVFDEISGSTFDRVHKVLLETVASGRLVWPRGWSLNRRPLPLRFNLRSARGKALAARLAELDPQRPNGEKVEWPGRTSAERLEESLIHGLLRLFVPGGMYAWCGNRFLVRPEDSVAFRRQLLTLFHDQEPEELERHRAWLRSHGVTDAGIRSIKAGNITGFIGQRQLDLDHLEEAFVARHRAVLNQNASSE